MFAAPAAAVESKPAPGQPVVWQVDGLPQTGTWLLDPSQAGSWLPGGMPQQGGAWTPGGVSQPDMSQPGMSLPGGQPVSQPGSWKGKPWKHGSRKPSPWTPGTQNPGTQIPGTQIPGTQVPGQPTVPTTPTTPVPATGTPAPTSPAPATGTPAGSSKEQTLQNEINRLIDGQRTSNGCAVLTVNDQLTTAARNHSQWMAQTGTFSHTGSGGSNFVARAKAAGYAQPSAENIAMGYRTAAQVVDGWMNSPGHRANIVNCKSKTVGVGVAFAADGSPYYTQVFGY